MNPDRSSIQPVKNLSRKIIGQDRFVLITKDRNISFLFDDDHPLPYAVLKYGKASDIKKEYLKHKKAYEFFPRHVPCILFYERQDKMAFFCIEYVPETHMSNVIASTWIWKKQRFIKEIEELFSLLLLLTKRYIQKTAKCGKKVDPKELETIFNVIALRFESRKEFIWFKDILSKIERINIPRIMQHGDFCNRNILYACKTRKVVIDWEDSKENHFPLVDFNMLLISVIEVYRELFNKTDEDFFNEMELRKIVFKMRRKLIEELKINELYHNEISLLSTAFLCAQNIKKERFKTADKIFFYLAKELSQQGDLCL